MVSISKLKPSFLGPLFQSVVGAFPHCHWFATPEEAADFLGPKLQSGDTCLFKGSRGSRVERILQILQDHNLS